jgi:hypothetical protein
MTTQQAAIGSADGITPLHTFALYNAIQEHHAGGGRAEDPAQAGDARPPSNVMVEPAARLGMQLMVMHALTRQTSAGRCAP